MLRKILTEQLPRLTLCIRDSFVTICVVLPRSLEVVKPPTWVKSDCCMVKPAVIDLSVVLAQFEEAVVKAVLIVVGEEARFCGHLVSMLWFW